MNFQRLTDLERGIAALAVCVVAFGGIVAMVGIEPASLRSYGVVDWIGHFFTALMVAIGLWALRLPIPIWSVLVGGVVPDFGHFVTFFGLAEEIAGSSRNGSHSLLLVIAVALVGFIDRRHANAWLGLALGALSHLWRDMGTGTVPLLWPMMDVVWGTSFRRYLAVILGMGIALVGSGMLLDVHAKASHRKQIGQNRS